MSLDCLGWLLFLDRRFMNRLWEDLLKHGTHPRSILAQFSLGASTTMELSQLKGYAHCSPHRRLAVDTLFGCERNTLDSYATGE